MKLTTKYVADNGVLFDRPESALQADFCHAMNKLGFGEPASELILEKFNEIDILRAKFLSAINEHHRKPPKIHHGMCATATGGNCTCEVIEFATRGAMV